MPRRKRDVAHEHEVLASTVRLDGVGEDPVVRAALSEDFVRADSNTALDISLALRQLIQGQDVILKNQQRMDEEIVRMRERQAKYEEAAERYEKNQEQFIQGLYDKQDRTRQTDPQRAASVRNQATEKLQAARAAIRVEQLQWEAKLAAEPKVTLVSTGRPKTFIENGTPVMKLIPEVISINNKQWILAPGVPTDVPQSVANQYFLNKRTQAELEERKGALGISGYMGPDHESKVIADKWNKIGQKYKSGGEMFPVGGD